MAVLLRAIYRFNAISIKTPRAFFTELEQIIQQFVEIEKSLSIQSNLEKEEQRYKAPHF